MATSTTLSTLEELRRSMPGGSNKAEAARGVAMQQAVAEAPKDVSSLKAARAIGQGLASQAGKDELSRISSAVQENEQQAGLTLKAGELQAAERIARKQELVTRLAEKNREKIYQLSKSVGNEIIDNRNQLKIDLAGRRYMNERQLLDYQLLTAKKQEDLQDYAQKLELNNQRKLQLMDAVYKRLQQAKTQAFQASEQELSQASKEKIARISDAYQKKMLDEKKKAAKRSGMASILGTVGGIAGGVIGSYAGPVGSSAGAIVGSQVGTAVGTYIGSEYGDQM